MAQVNPAVAAVAVELARLQAEVDAQVAVFVATLPQVATIAALEAALKVLAPKATAADAIAPTPAATDGKAPSVPAGSGAKYGSPRVRPNGNTWYPAFCLGAGHGPMTRVEQDDNSIRWECKQCGNHLPQVEYAPTGKPVKPIAATPTTPTTAAVSKLPAEVAALAHTCQVCGKGGLLTNPVCKKCRLAAAAK